MLGGIIKHHTVTPPLYALLESTFLRMKHGKPAYGILDEVHVRC